MQNFVHDIYDMQQYVWKDICLVRKHWTTTFCWLYLSTFYSSIDVLHKKAFGIFSSASPQQKQLHLLKQKTIIVLLVMHELLMTVMNVMFLLITTTILYCT